MLTCLHGAVVLLTWELAWSWSVFYARVQETSKVAVIDKAGRRSLSRTKQRTPISDFVVGSELPAAESCLCATIIDGTWPGVSTRRCICNVKVTRRAAGTFLTVTTYTSTLTRAYSFRSQVRRRLLSPDYNVAAALVTKSVLHCGKYLRTTVTLLVRFMGYPQESLQCPRPPNAPSRTRREGQRAPSLREKVFVVTDGRGLTHFDRNPSQARQGMPGKVVGGSTRHVQSEKPLLEFLGEDLERFDPVGETVPVAGSRRTYFFGRSGPLVQRGLDGARRVTTGDLREFQPRGRGDLRTSDPSAVTMSSLPQADRIGRDAQGSKRPRVLGLGSAGVDFIALVDRYPPADAKIRTESLDIMGGGNCGNTLSAVSRLGLDACLATKVGSDANGRLILEGLEDEGVDVSRVIVSDKTPSAFTYIIVDKEKNTRTCLHTPQTEDILPEEISPDLLEGVSVVHLDSRHTLAAIALATLANQRGVPVVLDAEKDRPHMKDLLPLADYVICNRNFPLAFTGRATHKAAIQQLLGQGRAKLVATTLGSEGCIVVSRNDEPPWQGYDEFSLPAGCPMDITTTVTSGVIEHEGGDAESGSSGGDDAARYVHASSWPVDQSDIVDTTGAGDSFIAAFIYGIAHQSGISRTIALASLVAAKKLSKPGARRGVPTLADLEGQWPDLIAHPE